MRVSDFDFQLPAELIAQRPLVPRDSSRLMVIKPGGGAFEHCRFRDLPAYLRPGDALVVNETRVIPARLIGEREGSGGAMEVLLLKRVGRDRWETLVKPGRKALPGQRVLFGDGRLTGTLLARTEAGGRVVEFSYEGLFETVLDELGQMPLPPYIYERLEDPEQYQTVYANERGSAAAPTAGLHFTAELLTRIEEMGVSVERLLLHVGLGTFRPVQAMELSEHKMHSEYFRLTPATAEALNKARAAGGRIIAVGTTCVRTLETMADPDGQIRAGEGWTEIFIFPGYRFKAVDAMVTNFHLPKSTLLMLVSAFAGRERIQAAYQEAICEGYRFFSFGDGMLIL